MYRETYPNEAYKLALLGLTDEEIAQFFGVHVDTVYEWDKVHPEFSEARARGKEPADANVAERLYKRALGYSHEAVKIFNDQGTPLVVPYTEHYPPDTQAITWWLKNRQGKRWQEKSAVANQQLDAQGNPTDPAVPVINVNVKPSE